MHITKNLKTYLTMGKINSSISALLLMTLVLLSCNSRPKDVSMADQHPDIYPDYVGVTVPVGLAPLDFTMADDGFDRVDVEVSGQKGGSIHANGRYADFDIDAWHQLLQQNRGASLTFTVCARKDGRWTRFRDFNVMVSADSLAAWGVTYRRLPPSYSMYSLMGLYERNLSNFEEQPLLENTMTPGQCMNCHTQNRTDPRQAVFHVRGSHGATVITRNGNVEVLKARSDSLGGSMVYPYWHPGGRYCAFSTNKTTQMFHTNHPAKRVEVYDTSSDIFVYDAQTRTVLRDTLTMRQEWSENTPAFSPDGKAVYFITALQQQYPEGFDKQLYSLCRVGFDETTGRLDGRVDTLVNTRVTGKSVSWPRPSYDGRYLMYTQMDYGYFSIWHPEADLWLLDLHTLQSRPLKEVNSARSESFHNWSADSRWFLFTSRSEDGLYTKLYFAHIDAAGHVSKPFLLPQRNPRQYYRRLLHSYNTPDFVDRPVHMDSRDMARRIEDTLRVAFTTR